MKNLVLFFAFFLFILPIKAQWTDNGANLTTSDNVGIGLNPYGIFNVKGGTSTTSYLNGVAVYNNAGTAIRSALSVTSDDHGRINLYNSSTHLKVFINSLGSSFFNGGNVGIGTTTPTSKFHVISDPLGQVAGNQSILTTIEGSVVGNNSKFQILNKRNSDGTNWNNTSLRLQRTVDSTPQTFIDFGIENENSNYGLAFGTRNGFGGTQQTRMVIEESGYVGIGTTNPDARLAVNGNIHTQEVKVDLIGWPDYVFEKDYDLPTLEEVESHIIKKGHLQHIPSAKEVEENGVKLGEINAKLLQKIEELTLYTIQQQKEIENLKWENEELKSLSERLTQVEQLLELKK